MPTTRVMTDRFLKYRTPVPRQDPTPYELLLLLQDIERGNDNFFILEHADDENRFAQVIRADVLSGNGQEVVYGTRAEQGYVVEYRDGGPDRHFRARCATLDRAHQILGGWAAGTESWRDLVEWERLDFSDEPTPDGEAAGRSGVVGEDDVDDRQVQYVRDETRAMIRAGFDSWSRVQVAATEMLDPDVSAATRRAAVEEAAAQWDARAAEQESWIDQGDYDRLAAAFADLESDGLIARMSFTCCNSCGNAEIGAEADPGGPISSGYVYFHSQDAARLADTPRTLYLAYGAFREALNIEVGPDGPTDAQRHQLQAGTRQVGRVITQTITGHGLEVVWDGDPASAVRVTITDWRKRLPR